MNVALALVYKKVITWRRFLSYRNQFNLESKSMDWFLHDRDLGHERVNQFYFKLHNFRQNGRFSDKLTSPLAMCYSNWFFAFTNYLLGWTSSKHLMYVQCTYCVQEWGLPLHITVQFRTIFKEFLFFWNQTGFLMNEKQGHKPWLGE